MATDINVSQLVINKMTQAQYQAAKEAGTVVETELYMITDGEEPATKAYVDNAIAAKAPMYTYGTEDLTAGTSELATGTLYFVYE